MTILRLALLLFFGASLAWSVQGQGAARRSFEVPYRLSTSVHLVVRAKVEGKGPFNLIVDTGAPVTFLAEEAAKKIGLKGDENLWCQVEHFELEGGLVIPKTKLRLETPFQLKGMNGMAMAGMELHGLIGYDLLARHRIEIDLTRDRMIWTPLDFEPKRPLGIGGKGKSSAGGLEVVGSIMKTFGALMGMKPPLPPRARGALGLELLDKEGQLLVGRVFPGTAAMQSGFQKGDILLFFNGQKVSSFEALRKKTLDTSSDKPFSVLVERAGKKVTLEVSWEEGF
ncbi:MAG: PDZ domain-containing protein [Gemmataceae bacterium]|nr:PDZ domain-containing protein [Gemmataceae bacterium]